MVLEYGALPPAMLVQDAALLDESTSLNDLLEDMSKSLKTKLEICRALVAHSKVCRNSALVEDFLEATLEVALHRSLGFEIILQAGMTMFRAIHDGRLETCQLLIAKGSVDIFLRDEENATTPFHIAARQKRTDILDLFLKHWDERYVSNGGKNDDGDYPLHVLCCDSKVSLEAIQLVVERQSHAVTTADGEQGLFPFHFAAMWDAKLDVIYHLLRHCPDALGRLPRAKMSSANGADISTNTTAAGNPPTPLAPAPCDGKPNGRNQVEEFGPLKKKVKVT